MGAADAGLAPGLGDQFDNMVAANFDLLTTIEMSKLRLLVLTTTFPRWQNDHEPGFVHELSKRLNEDFDVTVLSPHAPGAKTQETIDNVKVVRFRYAPERLESLAYAGGIGSNLKHAKWKYLLLQGFLLSFFFTAIRTVRRQQIDVVHAHWMIPGGLIGAALKILFPRLRVVVTSHGADVFQLKAPLFAKARRWVAAEVDAVTVVGSSLADQAKAEDWFNDKVSIAPMGVDLQHTFTPRPSPQEHTTLVFAGRLVEKKGVRHLIEAMPLIKRSIPEIRLLVAGHGPLQSELERQVDELDLSDTVTLLGRYHSSELPDIFGQANIAVLPFIEAADGDVEGFGLTTVEAMGCGLPVVVGDVPAIHDIVVHRETGYMLSSASAAAIADAIRQLHEDPALAERLATHGRQRARQLFDWSCVAQCYSDVLADKP